MIIKGKTDGGYKVIACGCVTSKGAELKTIGEKGTPKLSFSLTVDSRKDGATYLNCEAFGERAEIYRYLQGGERLLVAGVLRTDKWAGRDGEEHTREVCKCEFVVQEGPTGFPQTDPKGFEPVDDGETELPF
jgi:single-stranded DNA-binding protein